MGRAMSSNWRKKGHELYDVEALYTDEVMERVLAALHAPPSADAGKIAKRVKNIAAILNGELYYRSRPRPSQKKLSLTLLSEKASEMIDALLKLDSDSRYELEKAAHTDTRPEADDLPRDLLGGDYKVSMVEHKLCRLIEWANNAEKAIHDGDFKKKKLDAEREALRALVTLWAETHPPKVGIGGKAVRRRLKRAELLALARAALDPVFKIHRHTPKLESACEELI